MRNRSRKSIKKIRKLICVCAIFGIFLSVSTYAWFIGMKTVNVNSFDIKIATTEGLFLSMNGKNWVYNLDVAGAPKYDGNTNIWAPDGLIPLSSVGDINKSSSRLEMYEKGSLTTTSGGYRLLAGKVDNDTDEQKGYVAFDLFIKNLSGNEYYAANNDLNEEAIYLNTNSEVKVSELGGIQNTGIENSVRIAFAQIGRVVATTGEADGDTVGVKNITDITCSDVAAGAGQAQVTGICRPAEIWEPNDTKHVENAIKWYSKSCKKRKETPTGDDETLSTAYDKTVDCKTVHTTNLTDETTPTYAISRALDIADHVDIYDGEYNTYTKNVADYNTYATAIKNKVDVEGNPALTNAKKDFKLVKFPYFTDSDKIKTGTNRPSFMTLAPNSITKVRVYVYIEGQDIDNYDFAQLGKQVSIKFGFTKERFTEDDVSYDKVNSPSTDITPTGNE